MTKDEARCAAGNSTDVIETEVPGVADNGRRAAVGKLAYASPVVASLLFSQRANAVSGSGGGGGGGGMSGDTVF